MSLFDNTSEPFLFILFGIIIVGFLIIDLGLLNKNPKVISQKSALLQSIFWVLISVGFGIMIYYFDGGSKYALEFFSAYLTEKALSVDNIFVIILILKYFSVDEAYYHKILFWGILGAIVFRAIFIFVGALLISKFYWILYIFGAFLVYSGIKIYFNKGDEKIEPEKNILIRLSKKILRITTSNQGGRFVIRRQGKWYFTPLFLVVLLIESTDLIFAVDSIPAAFAITQNEFIIYTSNIFAVMGLRAMFFLLAGVLERFYFLQKGLSIVLIFIGGKMLLEIFHIEVPVFYSFSFIIFTLIASILLSVWIPKSHPGLQEEVKK